VTVYQPPDTALREPVEAGIPVRPRLRDGAFIVADGADGVLISGLRSKVVRGDAARSAIMGMAHLLDGTRTTRDIASACRLTPRQAGAVVEILHHSGALEDAERAVCLPGQDRHAAAFASRYLNYTSTHSHSSQVMRDIADARVFVLGQSELARIVASELAAAGIGEVVPAGLAPAPSVFPRAIVVYVDDGDAAPRGAAESSMRNGLSVLRVTACAGLIEIGPLFIRGLTACIRCFEASYRAEPELAAPGTEASPSQMCLAAGLVVNETLALAACLTVPLTYRHLIRLSLPYFKSEGFMLIPEPGCESCGTSAIRAGSGITEQVLQYEWAVEGRPDEPICLATDVALAEDPSAHTALQTVRRDYQTCPAMALPAVVAADDEPAWGRRAPAGTEVPPAIDVAVLAEILARVAGRKPRDKEPGDHNLRWAPTGGNLGSAELHVITLPGDNFGLPGNIVKYDDLRHELIAIRPDTVPLDDVMNDMELDRGGLLALIVMSAAIGRVARKYGTFSYRLAHLDAGCAAVQLVTTAAARGCHVVLAGDWDDAVLADVLDLRPPSEIVTAVAGLY
jgi:SagB-type dehydrogenase family enzyme